MPVYEYYCRTCDTKFEKLLPMSASDTPVECPSGHTGVLRTVSLVAATTKGSDGASLSSGGCACGGACSCGRQ